MADIDFKKEWITKGADSGMVVFAEQKGRKMAGIDKDITLSQFEQLKRLQAHANKLKVSKSSNQNDGWIEDIKAELEKIIGISIGENDPLTELRSYMGNDGMSNSQIRNVYGEVKRIQMTGDFEKSKMSFYLLKPKMAYSYGRSNTKGMRVYKEVFDQAFDLVTDWKTFQNFCNLMEALLAYHRAYGGKE